VVLAVCAAALAAGAGCATLRPGTVADNVVTARQLSLQGIDAMQRERWEEAEQLFVAAIRTNESDERAHRRYAELLWRRGVRDDAIRHMENAERLSGGDLELVVQLGGMYLREGNLDAAWQQAEQAIHTQTELPCAWALRGDIFAARNQFHDAMISYHRALAYQPHFPKVQLALTELYAQQNRPRRALATVSALVDQYGPDRAPTDVLLLQGLALKTLGRYDDAIDVLTAARNRGDANVELLYSLSESHWLAGDVANAGLAVQVALAQDPTHAPSRRLQSDIRDWQRSMTASLRPAGSGS
jgi:tetratricopeptide (TPR) repeat protein